MEQFIIGWLIFLTVFCLIQHYVNTKQVEINGIAIGLFKEQQEMNKCNLEIVKQFDQDIEKLKTVCKQ